MKTYLFYSKSIDVPATDILNKVTILNDNFTIMGFLFGLFWLLYNRLWKQSIIVVLLMVIMNVVSYYYVSYASLNLLITTVISLYIGFNGYDMVQRKIYQGDYKFCNIILAENQELASMKFLKYYSSSLRK